ncbi:MAG TPA: hypothetical protein VGO58_17040 [Chitinophagaceae bacterium]|jgi:hypothetical protein|nr:hypothetical protein [Chitinophagaceae bacterium]
MKKLIIYFFLLAGSIFLSTDSFARKKQPPDSNSTVIQDNGFRSNIESLVRYQEEQRAKQKRAAIIRIGIGVGLLAVLVIGLRRRGKK